MRTIPLLAALSLLSACTYQEGLIIEDMTGTVVLPEEAATRTFTKQDGSTETLEDVRLIGPVYLGLFPGVREGLQVYPHPDMGPIFQPGVPGDTYPYGGTTVGDLRYPCFESLVCRVSSGRYLTFDDLVEWFNVVLEDPIVDAFGDVVSNGDYVRQVCYDLLYYTTDEEIQITPRDRNDDGVIDAKDLDFVKRSDGKWEAEFTFWQQEYFEDEDSGQGFTLWGWMDAPSEVSYQFSTCDPEYGYYESTYSSKFYGGTQYNDLLNYPSLYISTGDWVAPMDGIHVYQGVDDEVEIHINGLVTGTGMEVY